MRSPSLPRSLAPLRRLLALLALALVGLAPGSRAAVAPGQPAPDFTVTDIAGQKHALSAYRGKIVVLEWLAPSCPYVLRHYRSGNLPATQSAAKPTFR